MKKTISYLLVGALALTVGIPLPASNFQGGDEIIINEPADGNQYLTGGKVKINAPVYGDVIAAGGELWIQDSVRDDVILIGGNLVINGVIGSDLRIMGGSITIKDDVWGDVIVTGGEIEIEKGVIIHGDLIVAGGEVTCGAVVEGDARVVGGELNFSGLIRREAKLRGGTLRLSGSFDGPVEMAAENISLAEGAIFRAPVVYWQKGGELDFAGYLAPGVTPLFDTSLKERLSETNWRHLGMGWIGFTIYRLLAGILLIALLVLLLHRLFTRHAGAVVRDWAPRLGYGTLLFIGLPVAGVLVMITIIGIPAGLFLFGIWGLAMVLGHGLTSTVLAYELEDYRHAAWGKGRIILVAAGLFLLMKVIGLIPFIGGVVNFLLTLVAFGHLVYSVWNDRRRPAPESGDVV